MRLFIKRSTSADKSCFTVFDEVGNKKYSVDFKDGKSVSKLIVSDNSGNAVMKIRRLPFVGAKSFVFKAQKRHITFVMIFSLNCVNCYFYGNNWHIKGEVVKGSFIIIDVDNSVVASQSNRSGYIELNITDENDELYCLATSICTNLINTVDKLAVPAV